MTTESGSEPGTTQDTGDGQPTADSPDRAGVERKARSARLAAAQGMMQRQADAAEAEAKAEESADPGGSDATEATESAAEQAAETEDAAAEAEATKPEPLEELAKRAAEKRKEREQAQREAAEANERESRIEARERELEEKLTLLARNPIKFLEETGQLTAETVQRLNQQILEPEKVQSSDELAAMRKELEALQEKLGEGEEARKTAAQRAQADEIYGRWAEVAADEAKYPLLSSLSLNEQRARGDEIADILAGAGEKFDLKRIAEYAEAQLLEEHQSRSERLKKTRGSAKGKPGKEMKDTAESKTRPKTLTNAQAAERLDRPRRRTRHDRLDAAFARLQSSD